MTASTTLPRIPLETLIDAIAQAVWRHASSHEVPALAENKLGLAPGTTEEAHRSKRIYIKTRIKDKDEIGLLKIARGVVAHYGDEELADLIDEITAPEQRLSELTRRDVLKALNPLATLFGDVDLFEGLNIIRTERIDSTEGDKDVFGLPTLAGQIGQHYLRNPEDWSHEELLIECGALSCTQRRFFRLLEKLLDPVVRRGAPQLELAEVLNPILAGDGFRAAVTGQKSRHPLYAIQRIASGVAGRPKNLVFAAINRKPDLYFADAINNDIAIRNQTDALIYDEFVNEAGLPWETLARWWQTREHAADITQARRGLYARLQHSVRAAQSPGQYALFHTYYREFSSRLGEALPALIPEVYLHYDPRTASERGRDPVLLRQRMDFLLLLDHNVRVVIEVDGSQHYSKGDRAAPAKYASMVQEDRRLRFAGYELYRFGAAEFSDTTISSDGKPTVGPQSQHVAVEFFNRLWRRHGVSADSGDGSSRGH